MANKPARIIDRPFQVRNKNFVRNRAKLKMVACRNCGRNHEVRKCPAYDKECHNLYKKNDFAKMCRSGQKQNKEVTLMQVEDYFGKFEQPYHMKMDPKAVPVAQSPRKIPATLRGKLEKNSTGWKQMRSLPKSINPQNGYIIQLLWKKQSKTQSLYGLSRAQQVFEERTLPTTHLGRNSK